MGKHDIKPRYFSETEIRLARQLAAHLWERRGTNAIGKPFSEKYDPNYKVKRVSTAHLYHPYSAEFRGHLTK